MVHSVALHITTRAPWCHADVLTRLFQDLEDAQQSFIDAAKAGGGGGGGEGGGEAMGPIVAKLETMKRQLQEKDDEPTALKSSLSVVEAEV